MKMKAILCCTVCLLIAMCMTVAAEDAGITVDITDEMNNIITVTAQLPDSLDGSEALLLVVNPGADISQLKTDNSGTTFDILQYFQSKTYHIGEPLTFVVPLLPRDGMGLEDTNYTIILKANGKTIATSDFRYFADTDAKIQTIEQLNALQAGGENNATVVDTAVKMFVPVDLSLYDGLTDKEAMTEKVLTLKTERNLTFSISDTKTIADLLWEAILSQAFSEGSSGLLQDGRLLYTDITGIEQQEAAFAYYTNDLTETGIELLHENLWAGDYTGYPDIADAFAEQAIIQAIYNNKLSGYGHIGTVIEENKERFVQAGLDYDAYQDANQREVLNAVLTNPMDTVEEIAQYINSQSESGSSNNGTSTGGGGRPSRGSSSGGSGGIVSSITTPETPEQAQPEEEAPMFSDLDTVPWAEESIQYLGQQQLIDGIGDGLFAPNEPLTREAFVKMIVNAFGLLDVTATADFADVPEGHWSSKYIASAVNRGIIQGIGDQQFGLGENIRREDMATILYRAMTSCGISLPAQEEAASFSDAGEISEYAAQAVAAMQTAGIITGSDGYFYPGNVATRAEAAKIIYEVLKAGGMLR